MAHAASPWAAERSAHHGSAHHGINHALTDRACPQTVEAIAPVSREAIPVNRAGVS